MKNERYFKIILAPHMSEKTALLSKDESVYVFEVAQDATKPEIKNAIEFLFKTKVRAVNVMNAKGKIKRTGRITGQRKSWKKAYVTLEKGQSIDLGIEKP